MATSVLIEETKEGLDCFSPAPDETLERLALKIAFHPDEFSTQSVLNFTRQWGPVVKTGLGTLDPLAVRRTADEFVGPSNTVCRARTSEAENSYDPAASSFPGGWY